MSIRNPEIAASLTYPRRVYSGGTMQTKTRPTFGRTLARAILGAITFTAVAAGAWLLVADTDTLPERQEVLANVVLGIVVIAGTAWLYPRIQRASEATLFRAAFLFVLAMLALGVYSIAAAAGIVPGAPWSALG